MLLAASYLLGLQLAMSRAKRAASTPTRVLDLGIYIIIAALVGAKLLLLVIDFDHVPATPRELLVLARSGGVFYGGLILAVVVAFWYIRAHGLPFWTTCDVFAPGIALGHVDRAARMLFRRLLLRQADDPAVGDHFTDPFAAANVGTPLGVPLHPTQLYEAGAELLILRAARDRTRAAGRSRADVLALHAALRGLALHHRVLPRRPARRDVRRVLDLAVHLARSSRRWRSSMLVWLLATRPSASSRRSAA